MRIKVFQINQDRDQNRVKFCGLQDTEQYQGFSQIDASLYDEVFNGEVDCWNLEDIYTLFNTEPPPFHRGHCLSPSDVVEVQSAPELVGRIRYYNDRTHFEELDYVDRAKYVADIAEAQDVGRHIQATRLGNHHVQSVANGFYFCDSCGFQNVDFDPSLTHKPDDLMRVVMVEPGKPAYEAEAENKLRPLQRAVGGLIEVTCPFGEDAAIISNEESKLIGLPANRRIYGEIYAGAFLIAGDNHEGEFCSLTDEQVNFFTRRFSQPEVFDDAELDESMDAGIQMS